MMQVHPSECVSSTDKLFPLQLDGKTGRKSLFRRHFLSFAAACVTLPYILSHFHFPSLSWCGAGDTSQGKQPDGLPPKLTALVTLKANKLQLILGLFTSKCHRGGDVNLCASSPW